MFLRLLALVAVIAATGCTGIGVHTSIRNQVDYGPPQQLRVCLLKADDVPEGRADTLIAAVNEEFAPFGIHVTVPWIRPWRRPGFSVDEIIAEVLTHELEEPCDRLVALVDRHAGDFVWGLMLPEVLGAVDTVTYTHGYVVATVASLSQIGPGSASPKKAMVHEFYHLVGCPHAATKSRCYEQIAAMKASRPPGSNLFPGMNPANEFIHSRAQINEALRQRVVQMAEEKKRRRANVRRGAQVSG